MGDNSEVARTFRALVESSDRKFARVREVPSYGRGPHRYFYKVFKAYTKLWKFQRENRSKLVESGLQRWEIGEIASRIGQLYYGQYLRTSGARFLLESYVFYEAILNRGYFEGVKGSSKDLSLRLKGLRFYARFLLVSLLLNRSDTAQILVERFKSLVDDCRANFREPNFKEWRQVVQESVRFMNVNTPFMTIRPLRYCTLFDCHPASLPYVARFHAKKILRLRDVLLTSYHRNEVKFTELTVDTFRMLQCLEWEPSGTFYQKRPVESNENGSLNDHSGASGLIDINLAVDMTDPTLPPNPRKAILYHPSVSHLIAVLATLCDELPADSILLLYISASGKGARSNASEKEPLGASRKSSKIKVVSQTSHEYSNLEPETLVCDRGGSSKCYENYLWLGPRSCGGSNTLYPTDIIPFTRRPLFLIIDSENSHAFKVMHGAERGETAAMLLSPLKPTFQNLSGADRTQSGSQFTFFLTAPLQAFCQLGGLSENDTNMSGYNNADDIMSSAFSEWEVTLCTSTSLDLVWAQVLSDPFLRRLILRFIFCRSVLYYFHRPGECDQYLPECLPHLPDSVSPTCESVQSKVLQLANSLGVVDCFHFMDSR